MNLEEKQMFAEKYLEAAQDLAAGRVRFAEAFTLARFQLGDKATDGQATQMAIAATKDEITVLTTILTIQEIQARRVL